MEIDNNDSTDSVYAGSGSRSCCSGGCCSSCRSSNSPLYSDRYLQYADSCCCHGANNEAVDSDRVRSVRSAAEILYRKLFGARPRAAVDFSGGHIQNRSGWTWSLLRISVLLACCSLSSLATCIALTGFSRSCFAADEWTESLLQPPLADRLSSVRHFSKQSDIAVRYNWDCVARAGGTKCRPVQKAQSQRKGRLSNVHQQYQQSVAAFRVLTDGVYHAIAQISGTAWQPSPTLLRVVIARAQAKSGSINVTTVHSITGVEGGDDALASVKRGVFSVHTAAIVRLSAGDELLAQVVCVEKPDCIVHINGTASHLTLERLD